MMSNAEKEMHLYNILQTEAIEKYYVDNAELPAIMICAEPWLHPDAKYGEKYTLYFGLTVAHYNFKTLKNARVKAKAILQTAKKPIEVTVKNKGNGYLRTLIFPKIMSS